MSEEKRFPAFPGGLDHIGFQVGMDLRDYFAAKALQGQLAAIVNPNWLNAIKKDAKNTKMSPQQIYAQMAYELADAMLKARGK